MELKEFIKKVLVDITSAVKEATIEAHQIIEIYGSPENRHVEFDIAVSVEETTSKSGKAGVKVLQFVEAGGDINRDNKNSTVSRIKFGVWIDNMSADERSKLNTQLKGINKQNYHPLDVG
ncbi:MAG: hypothetical protein NTZ10_00395 [Candidatus Saganbacteria bacterium]|nr:hypothetical protein [Candidatus Saganbacteria bacterium]